MSNTPRDFDTLAGTRDSRKAAFIHEMATRAGLSNEDHFHVRYMAHVPSKLGNEIAEEWKNSGLKVSSELKNCHIEKVKFANSTFSNDRGQYFQTAMSLPRLEKDLTEGKETASLSNTVSRGGLAGSHAAKTSLSNAKSLNIITTLLTGENTALYGLPINSLDLMFSDYNRLAPQNDFGFFSDQIAVANRLYAGSGLDQGTSSGAIAQQRQKLELEQLDIQTRTLMIEPPAIGEMNDYAETVVRRFDESYLSAQINTMAAVEREVYGDIIGYSGDAVETRAFSTILSGVADPSGLTSENGFNFVQSLGQFFAIFSENKLNSQPKKMAVPVEDYWRLKRLIGSFTVGGTRCFTGSNHWRHVFA